MPKTFVVIRTQFEALHCWPSAPEEVAFLREPHRHMFHVEMKWLVHHDDRDIEFFMMKWEVQEYINSNMAMDLGHRSCEMICKQLADHFKADYVSVFEDGENGAEYYRTFEPR
jgi:hypothetical protein